MPYKKDEIACECSVVGVFGCPDAVYSCRDGLHATSHRGQDDVGIATSAATEKSRIVCRKHLGLARDVPKSSLRALAKKDFAIGHNRYATAGPVDIHLAQPFVTTRPMLGYAANGDIPPRFYQRLKRMLKKNGVELATRNDGELSSALLAYKLRQGSSLEQAIREFMQEVTGSYAAVMLYKQYGIAFRDPLGIRPLVLGRGRKDNSWWMVASETTALQIAGADYQREVLPGELLIFAKGCEPVSIRLVEMPCHQQCIFELIYFSRPDSLCFGIPVSAFRKELGRRLSLQGKTEAELVFPVPDSSNQIALGYAQESGLPFDMGLYRSHYTGRTFIEPNQRLRDDGVRLKFNPDQAVTRGKRVLMIDDSLVRGTTTRQVVGMLRSGGGAKEVHIGIGSPPVRWPCYYGIATPDAKELIAVNLTTEQIRQQIDADSLSYLTISDLHQALIAFGADPRQYCMACFTGEYPTAL